MNELPIHVIVAIDDEGNEALYVGGDLIPTDGDTVYATDIATAAGDSVIQFSHIKVEFGPTWPERFEDLKVIS